MADLKIYNNGENKVLMSAGDRIIRQPYEFGNAFAQTAQNCYIDIDIIHFGEFTIFGCSDFNYIGGNAGYVKSFVSWLDADDNNYVFGGWDYGDGYIGLTKNANLLNTSNLGVPPLPVISVSPISASKNFFFKIDSRLDKTKNNFYVNSVSHNQTSWIEAFTDIKRIRIGAHRTSAGSTPNVFQQGGQKNNRLILFNRQVPDSEYFFYFNNRIGSNLQSREGVILDIIMDRAEILDFSALQDGSDLRVGCRDYSGFNRHGQIMNLPVGSLADQLAFANANLFVPFIQ